MKLGLSQRVLIHNNQAYDSVEHGWYNLLCDHELSFIKNTLNQDLKQIANDIDGFIITGGDDSVIRRTVEIKLAIEMLKMNKPIIGVCHGCFLLQDILGGKVVEIDHHYNINHYINYKDEKIEVNSYHSLAIEKVHQKGTVLAVDNSGLCEAWIDGKIAGMVWHPERMEQPFIPEEILNLLKGI